MNMRVLVWLGVAALSATLSFSALSQQRTARVALVIGNANYPDASTPLSTTIRDVRTVGDELRRSDFEVDLKENLGKEDMQRAIEAFTGKIRTGMTALFYFSGYGIQVARQTYLIPVNVQVWAEPDVRRDGISVEGLLAELHRKGAKVKIVILDAARRNPFERRFRAVPGGLATLDMPEGTLAMYSAAPGRLLNDGTGANSLFVSELMKEIRSPNLTAEEVFNRTRIGVSRASNNEQIPWVASSLLEDFYFGTSRVATTPARRHRPHRHRRPPPPPPPPLPPLRRRALRQPSRRASLPAEEQKPESLSGIARDAAKWWCCRPARSIWARTRNTKIPCIGSPLRSRSQSAAMK